MSFYTNVNDENNGDNGAGAVSSGMVRRSKRLSDEGQTHHLRSINAITKPPSSSIYTNNNQSYGHRVPLTEVPQWALVALAL
jgi:hypothetical protein